MGMHEGLGVGVSGRGQVWTEIGKVGQGRVKMSRSGWVRLISWR